MLFATALLNIFNHHKTAAYLLQDQIINRETANSYAAFTNSPHVYQHSSIMFNSNHQKCSWAFGVSTLSEYKQGFCCYWQWDLTAVVIFNVYIIYNAWFWGCMHTPSWLIGNIKETPLLFLTDNPLPILKPLGACFLMDGNQISPPTCLSGSGTEA